MADRHGPLRLDASALLVDEATFLGETEPISPPDPVKQANAEAKLGKRLNEVPTVDLPADERFLLGLHATDPPLGSGARDARDSLIGISPPLSPGGNTDVGIRIWYRNPFPIEKTAGEPEPNWTAIRPYPESDGSHPDGTKGEFFNNLKTDEFTATGSLSIAVTLWHGPPAVEGGRSGPIRDNEDNVIGATDAIAMKAENLVSLTNDD